MNRFMYFIWDFRPDMCVERLAAPFAAAPVGRRQALLSAGVGLRGLDAAASDGKRIGSTDSGSKNWKRLRRFVAPSLK